MSLKAIFDPANWASVPFDFWAGVFFVYGGMVGSFLNVCIHRMPLGESIVSPPSHCPHCKYSIPWYLNVPLVTWVYLRGRCRNCGAPIAARYFLVELLTAVVFMYCWLQLGHISALLALAACLILAGLIAASFIDLEHYIIPDEITLGGMAVGLVLSLAIPQLHALGGEPITRRAGFIAGVVGLLFGICLVYAILRIGKWFIGRQKLELGAPTRVVFLEDEIVLPDGTMTYEEIFYRPTDAIILQATLVELCDRCYRNVSVRLSPSRLEIDNDVFDPEDVPFLEATTERLVIPREAMGLGDVKIMGAIGAFLGWQAVAFSLGVSSLIGSAVGLTLIALHKRDRSQRLPYGPYIALAAAIWIFGGHRLWNAFFHLQ